MVSFTHLSFMGQSVIMPSETVAMEFLGLGLFLMGALGGEIITNAFVLGTLGWTGPGWTGPLGVIWFNFEIIEGIWRHLGNMDAMMGNPPLLNSGSNARREK